MKECDDCSEEMVCCLIGVNIITWTSHNTTISQTMTSDRVESSPLWHHKHVANVLHNLPFSFPFIYPSFYNPYHRYLPISGLFASSASSVLKRVLGKRMKIFDLQKVDKEICDQRNGNMPIEHFNPFSLGGPIICCTHRASHGPPLPNSPLSPSNSTLPAQFVLLWFVA